MCTLDNVVFVKSVQNFLLIITENNTFYCVASHDPPLVAGELDCEARGDGDEDQGAGEGRHQAADQGQRDPAPARPPVLRVETLLLSVDHNAVQTKQGQSGGK